MKLACAEPAFPRDENGIRNCFLFTKNVSICSFLFPHLMRSAIPEICALPLVPYLCSDLHFRVAQRQYLHIALDLLKRDQQRASHPHSIIEEVSNVLKAITIEHFSG